MVYASYIFCQTPLSPDHFQDFFFNDLKGACAAKRHDLGQCSPNWIQWWIVSGRACKRKKGEALATPCRVCHLQVTVQFGERTRVDQARHVAQPTQSILFQYWVHVCGATSFVDLLVCNFIHPCDPTYLSDTSKGEAVEFPFSVGMRSPGLTAVGAEQKEHKFGICAL